VTIIPEILLSWISKKAFDLVNHIECIKGFLDMGEVLSYGANSTSGYFI
jgi:hypothetical protein